MTGRRAGPPSAPELEGFLAGLTDALERRRRSGLPDPEGESELARAARLLERGRLIEAETALEAVDQRERDRHPEPVVSQPPRGLLGYRAIGPSEVPTPEEEDRLSNRLLLLERLAGVRARSGADVDRALAVLREARAALAKGDRSGASRRLDQALDVLEPDPRGAVGEP